ncbi:MAG: class I SAM-dependent methyltransferase [Paracoccaceae bacterium]
MARSLAGKHAVLLRQAIRLRRPGAILEFGVYRGTSARLLARMFPFRQIHGFDSFEGFPANGRPDWQIDFAGIEPPPVPRNVTLHRGWFHETLPQALAKLTGPIGLVYIDCDLYSSTACVLDKLAEHGYLKPGLPIVFDELLNYDTHLWNELLAMFEALEAHNLGIRWTCVGGSVRPAPEALQRLAQGHFGEGFEQDREAGYPAQASVVLTTEAEPWLPAPPELIDALRVQTARFLNGELRRD